MYLIKSCEKDYLLDRTKSIRLGSLRSFRANPHVEVGDDQEAALETNLIIDIPTHFPSNIMNAITDGGIHFGSYGDEVFIRRPKIVRTHVLKAGAVSTKSVEIERLDCKIVTEGSDALIFCMTQASEKNLGPSLDYDSAWSMNLSDADRFGENLLRELNAQLKSDPDKFVSSDQRLYPGAYNDLQFRLKHGVITYRPLSLTLRNPSVDRLTEVADIIENSDMFKREKYCHQNEYRFCFRLISAGRLVGLQTDFIDIDATNFRSFQL